MIIVANWREKTETSFSLMRSERNGILRSLLRLLLALLLDLDGHVAHRAQLADDELRVLGFELALDQLAGLVADLVGEGLGHRDQPFSRRRKSSSLPQRSSAMSSEMRPLRTSCTSDMSIVTMP